MSTPTTATATLPPHYRHPHQHSHYPPYSHLQGGSSYRAALPSPSTANPILPTSTSTATAASTASSRHVPASSYSTNGNSSTAAHAGSQQSYRDPTTNGAAVPVTSTARATQNYTRTDSASTPRSDANHHNMPVSTTTTQSHSGGQARKRRRSKEPDWNSFYKNGLPKEIIVIDDTPDPDDDDKDVASYSTRTYTNGTVNGSDAGPQHVAKKRKKDDGYPNARTTNGSQIATPNSGSTSTDRTTSAHITTAATSLGSLSSNGQYDYEIQQTGQKRKRTRQYLAQEAKRREVEVLGDAYVSYRPPQKPVKKSGEVAVRVVSEVS